MFYLISSLGRARLTLIYKHITSYWPTLLSEGKWDKKNDFVSNLSAVFSSAVLTKSKHTRMNDSFDTQNKTKPVQTEHHRIFWQCNFLQKVQDGSRNFSKNEEIIVESQISIHHYSWTASTAQHSTVQQWPSVTYFNISFQFDSKHFLLSHSFCWLAC